MNHIFFEIETGLKAEEHKETFMQWEINKRLEHLNDALTELYQLVDKLSNVITEEDCGQLVNRIETDDTNNQPD